MNNQELEKKIKEIINMNNFFDMVIAAKQFEKEYKDSEFYKITKMPIFTLIENAKKWYLIDIKEIGNKIQSVIDSLSLEKINDLANQLGNAFERENNETREILEEFKNIAK